MITHRALDGRWALCPDADTCELLFHFPDATPAAMAELPFELLLPVLEIMDPPHEVRSGVKLWLNQRAQLERAYDLPAVIEVDGGMSWHRDGIYWRTAELPTLVYPNGGGEWWVDGICVVTLDAPDAPYHVLEGGIHVTSADFPAGRLHALAAAERGEGAVTNGV